MVYTNSFLIGVEKHHNPPMEIQIPVVAEKEPEDQPKEAPERSAGEDEDWRWKGRWRDGRFASNDS